MRKYLKVFLSYLNIVFFAACGFPHNVITHENLSVLIKLVNPDRYDHVTLSNEFIKQYQYFILIFIEVLLHMLVYQTLKKLYVLVLHYFHHLLVIYHMFKKIFFLRKHYQILYIELKILI